MNLPRLCPEKSYPLKGKLMRVAYYPSPPNTNTDVNDQLQGGIAVDLLAVLQHKFGFRCSFNFSSHFALLKDDGSPGGCLGYLLAKKVDMIMDGPLVDLFTKVVDFSGASYNMVFHALVPKPKRLLPIFNILYCFDGKTWVMSICSFFALTLTVAIIMIILKQHKKHI